MRVISDVDKPASLPTTLLRLPLFWILLTGILAMGGALRADFYMDDFGFIVNSKGDGPAVFKWAFLGTAYGSEALDASATSLFQLIPTVITVLNGWLFPANPVAAHAWNLGIHLFLSALVFRCGEPLLRRLRLLKTPEARRQAAVIGAMIFACHPLATEPVHYAKCHMVQLVALFSFWATCEAAEFLSAPNRRRGLRVLAIAALGVISYFPGTVLLGFNFGVLSLFLLTGRNRDELRRFLPDRALLRRPAVLAGLGLTGAAVLWLLWFFVARFWLILDTWGAMFPVHVATQGRVFWEYVQRILIPVHLASDHYQPWSTFRDPEAVIKLVLLGVVLACALAGILRKGNGARRGLCLLVVLALIPFAMRLLYVNIEIMVEYRAYNALPWIGLLAGCGLTALAERIPARRIRWLPAAALVTLFIILSAERGAVWRSGAALAGNVLTQYPLNNRARTQLQSIDIDSGRYAEVLRRHEEVLAVRDRIDVLNAAADGRVLIDTLRADTNVIGSYQFAVYARAELEGTVKALEFADHAITSLRTRLPAQFKLGPHSSLTGAWPLLEARDAVGRAQAAGYVNPALSGEGR